MCKEGVTAAQYALLQQQIRQLEERCHALEAENAALRARLAAAERADDTPSGPPAGASRFKANRTPRAPGTPRKKRAHNAARKRGTATRRVEHAVACCRRCGCTLRGGSVKRTREVLHIPLMPVEVVEHAFIERQCPQCGQRETPGAEVLAGEVVGRCRVSASTMALIAALREVGRLPIATIQWLLDTFHGLHLSRGELVAILRTVATQAKQMVAQVQAEVRRSPVVHADETSWRQEGRNGYFWVFCTPRWRYFLHRCSRSGDAVLETLGEDFVGVLVSDFYSGYTRLLGRHQRCWAHLLRAIHELKEKHTADEGLRAWAQAVHSLYQEAVASSRQHPAAPAKGRLRQQRDFEERLMTLCRPHLSRDAPQTVLCQRVERFLPELFVFVAEADVPPDNNAAERAIRPLAVSRKISGGTRGAEGTAAKEVLATIFGSWLLNSRNPFFACRDLLISPQV